MLLLTREHFAVAASTALVVVLAVLAHYEASQLLSRFVAATRVPPRPRMLVLIFGLLAAHVVEIWLFAFGAWALLGVAGAGALSGASAAPGRPGLLDVVYVSATTYTTLGYGDLVPVGHLRFLFGMEALTGLLLITWSASLTFLEMQRHWQQHPRAAPQAAAAGRRGAKAAPP